MTRRVLWSALLVLTTITSGLPAQEPPPAFLRDRGGGVATSIFGTYVRKGELIVYPFYEYVQASNDEYHGAEPGFVGEIDYLGESREHEAVLFLAYGLTENLAVELEGELYVSKTLEGFRWGTLTSRISVGYEGEEAEFALGEYAIEYLKRLSKSWLAYSVIEGEDDELSLLLGAQWQLGPRLYGKLSTGVGLTPKADDVAPEVGLLLSF